MISDENKHWQTAYIGLGSNIGDRGQYLDQAIRLLHAESLITVEKCSHVYETAPIGFTEQPSFLNQVIRVNTGMPPQSLLANMLAVEQKLGRKRELRWGPRTIDLDLLLYNESVLNLTDLILPHPRMFERAFVMIPLMDVLDIETSGVSESILEALEKLDGKDGVKLWKEVSWPNESGHFGN